MCNIGLPFKIVNIYLLSNSIKLYIGRFYEGGEVQVGDGMLFHIISPLSATDRFIGSKFI